MELFLGIDFGTSGARAIAIGYEGRLHCQVSEEFPAVPPEDWPDLWHQVLWSLIRQIPAELRQSLRTIAVNGTSSTVLLVDRQGQPMVPPLLYNDARGQAVLPYLQKIAPPHHTVLSATSSLAKLLWWHQQRSLSQARYLMHQADWLAFLLHGQLGMSDYHNSLKLGYDVEQLAYPDWVQKLPVLPLLPKVLPPGTVIGPVTSIASTQLGLSPTCLVCTGTTDSIAAFLASGAHKVGDAVTSLGSTLVLKLLSSKRLEDSRYGIYSHRLGNSWLVGGASNTGGAVLRQFFSLEELQTLSQQIDPEQVSNLNYYPLLQPGERFPINDPALPPRLEPQPADRQVFLHGLLESIARIEAQGYRLLQELGTSSLLQVYTAGGGAANSTWTKMRARHLQVPVKSATQTEAAYGTACLAAGLII